MEEQLISFGHQSLAGIQLDNLSYNLASLLLSLSNDKEKLAVKFEWTYSFRVTDEGDLLKMLDHFDGKMTTGIYQVKNSAYLNWFYEQSCRHHQEGIEHYLIVTLDDVIDVLSVIEPSIEII